MSDRRKLLRQAFWAVLACSALAGPASAQQYPDRPVRIVVPFAPGGADVLVRAVAAEIALKWKQPVVVENRPGAGSIIGAEYVAKLEPDGYTLLATVDATPVINRFLYKSQPYDPDKAFAPISLMVQTDGMLLANTGLPVNNLRELVALAKARPRTLSFGSYARGSQADLVFALINRREGVDFLPVPYKDVAAAMGASVGGEVQLAMAGASVSAALVHGGKLKVLAIAGEHRNAQFPQVPTAKEQGFDYVRSSVWYGVYAPAGTPASVVARIHEDVTAILQSPAFVERHVRPRGFTVLAGGPADLLKRIRHDVELTAEMVKAAGVVPK